MEITEAIGEMKTGEYILNIPSMGRSLRIQFDPEFPYTIEGWTETYANKGENYSSTAKRIHTERRQYWAENDKRFESLRIPFKLD